MASSRAAGVPAERRAARIRSVRRVKPSLARAARIASLSEKWWYGAWWLTPARRATSRSESAWSPSVRIRFSAASRTRRVR